MILKNFSYQKKSVWVGCAFTALFLSPFGGLTQKEEYLYQGRYGDKSGRYSLGVLLPQRGFLISYGESAAQKTLFVGPAAETIWGKLRENLGFKC
ncbi:MAG: hypothetical protein CM15mP88_2470 [Pseudomonadota bacterium]|nr:MAG: hypothetical protein CM15mP88_2470 [Pseudomonadota bacterium]